MIHALIQGFDPERFCRFLRSKFPSFAGQDARLPTPDARRTTGRATPDGSVKDCPANWADARRLGIVKTLPGPNGLNQPLLVAAAKLPDGEPLKERSSRQRQFDFARRALDQAMADPAPGIEGVIAQGLFVFYDDAGNFRLSLVHAKAQGARLVWSSARRLSFYVEAGAVNRTFSDRMALDWSTFDKLKDAFSVEKLTKEFYNRLFAWYQRAMADTDVWFPNDIVTDKEPGEVKSEQLIRLITRLMFVWFIKQKQLVPDTLFNPAELRRILKAFDPLTGDTYYRAILQNLFFATLNSEIDKRDIAFDEGYPENSKTHNVGNLYRYENAFQVEAPTKRGAKDALLKVFKGIPFLNGGLFECLDKRRDEKQAPKAKTKYFDGFTRNSKKQARVPNRLFFDDAEGLIPLLKQYNFTIEENAPGDEDVALDPELLGKVFENLLGAYNPETKTAARNATGSFYTPREIVNYMVDESLKAHLLTKVGQEEKVGQAFLPAQTAQKEAGPAPLGQRIEALFAPDEQEVPEFSAAERRKLVDALFNCRMLDPACGSGAFPMGALLKMVHLLRRLDPKNSLWNQVVLDRTEAELKAAESLDAAQKREHLKRVTDHFDQSVNAPDYARKLYLIEYGLYGVDIQPIAVQIAKLRAFITLVCDQQPDLDDPDRNYGMLPLPNLETKFVAADSLIGLSADFADGLKNSDGVSLLNDPELQRLRTELAEVRHQHFRARNAPEKTKCREHDEMLRRKTQRRLVEIASTPDTGKIARWQDEIAKLQQERKAFASEDWREVVQTQPAQAEMFATESTPVKVTMRVDVNKEKRDRLDDQIRRHTRFIEAEQSRARNRNAFQQEADRLAAWDPYDQNTNAKFFDPEWMFNVKDGFDVVIGNPPYVQIQKLPEKTKTALAEQTYRTFSKTADLYCLFYERGGVLLTPEGNLCYISSNKFFRSGYGKPLRQLLSQHFALRLLIDFGELPVFEAGTDPVIVQFCRAPRETFTAATIKDTHDIPNLREAIAALGQTLTPADLSDAGWSLTGKASADILKKMCDRGTPLGEVVKGEIYYGIKTGFNEAFILTTAQRDALVAVDPKSAEIIKPLAKGDDVRKWHVRDKGRWIILTKIGVDIQRYPAIFKHLRQWESELKKRQDQGEHWWELRACAYYDDFDKPKIMFADIAKFMRATFDTTGMICVNTMYIVPTQNLLMLGFLNGRLFDWYARNAFQSLGDPWKGGRMRFIAQFMENVPIPPATPRQRAVIESLVNRILDAKKADPDADTSELEAEIDRLVYRLYELTPEEIAIVEGAARTPDARGPTPGSGADARGPAPDSGADARRPAPDSGADARRPKPGLRGAPKKRPRKPTLPPSQEGWS